ncbi:uncharacterized protein N7503_005769 [Penicillium pulvis]|uniref:uncharacterized protein n=1 Tax=Penicillium pulvis TaxID=1562058 RepID=UPI0025484448|nr:uncharacterized protein N7503_005769 [Penicillium pulvis]KAJ5803319.1 hypothetical protein N7503_005769 [Penicillium pulvis]
MKKCDERHPVCSQCTTSERFCEYLQWEAKRTVPIRRSLSSTPASSTIQDSPSNQTLDDDSAALLQEPPVNILHAELFCHLVTDTLPLIQADELGMANVQILKCSSVNPYLMNELLALAATHISILRPSDRSLYRHHAAQLQNHALASFHSSNNPEKSEEYMSRFIFSSVLGMHMLCDTLNFRDPDFTAFLDTFTHYLRIHCGVRSVIRDKWHILTDTALGPILRHGASQLEPNTGLGPECSRLLKLVEKSKLGPSITQIYQTTIEGLQKAFNSVFSTNSPRIYSVGVHSWPVTVPSEYIDLLARRAPDALVILAHFAVILHSHRDNWLFGDGGRYLIQSISEYLGPDWEEWLVFPNQVLSEATAPMTHC